MLLFTGIPVNRQKLGISGEPQGPFFYNRFISNILFNPMEESNEATCMRMLEKAALVSVEMTRADAILLEKSIESSISQFTTIGGLLGLYAGFSFLSLAELGFWILRLVFKILCCKLNK